MTATRGRRTGRLRFRRSVVLDLRNRLRFAVVGLLGLIGLHVVAMMAFEGLSLGDAIWLTFTTITTTGYGDFSAKTRAGRASTIALIHLSGISMLTQAGAAFFELRALRRDRQKRARRHSGWPATRPALCQPACPQLCALTLKTTARQRTRADPVGPEMPERLAQLAPARHVDDLDKVDDRKRADHALARPALFITVRDHELALLADGPAHKREVQVLRLRRAPCGRVQADIVDRLLGAMRQNAGHLGPDGLRRRFQALVAGSTEQAQRHDERLDLFYRQHERGQVIARPHDIAHPGLAIDRDRHSL